MSIKYPTRASIAEHMVPLCYSLGILVLLEHKAVFCRNDLLSLCLLSPVQLHRGGLLWHQSFTRMWMLRGSKAQLHSFTSTPGFSCCQRLYNWPAETTLPLTACTDPHEEGGGYRGLWTQNPPLLRQAVRLQREQHNLSLSFISNNIATLWIMPEISFTVL